MHLSTKKNRRHPNLCAIKYNITLTDCNTKFIGEGKTKHLEIDQRALVKVLPVDFDSASFDPKEWLTRFF